MQRGLNENKLSSSGDERVQSGMHIEKCNLKNEKWFLTFQRYWFQKILHVCLLLICRKTDSENFKWRDIGLPLLWYFKVREVVADMSCSIAHFSGCYCYGNMWKFTVTLLLLMILHKLFFKCFYYENYIWLKLIGQETTWPAS